MELCLEFSSLVVDLELQVFRIVCIVPSFVCIQSRRTVRGTNDTV